MRIHATNLLPILSNVKPKSTYFMCILNESCKLNYLKDTLEDGKPNEISNDNLNNTLKWMEFSSLRTAQKNYHLMGLEPVYVYKKYILDAESDQNNNLRLLIENVFYEPKVTYFPELNGQQLSPTEQLVVSAKFNKNSKILFLNLNVFQN